MGSISTCIIFHTLTGEASPDAVPISKSFTILNILQCCYVCFKCLAMAHYIWFLLCLLCLRRLTHCQTRRSKAEPFLIRFLNAIFITTKTEGIQIKCEKVKMVPWGRHLNQIVIRLSSTACLRWWSRQRVWKIPSSWKAALLLLALIHCPSGSWRELIPQLTRTLVPRRRALLKCEWPVR